MESADLPVVDLGQAGADDVLRRGLTETGFFHLVDHEIPAGLLAAIREATASFFALPLEQKQPVTAPLRGYVALREEDTESGYGDGDYGGGDLCEKYTMGHEATAAELGSQPEYYGAPEAEMYFAPNLFPNDEFARAWTEYFEHMQALSQRLMAAVRRTLGFPPDAWSKGVDRPADIMRFLNYPEVSNEQVRMAAHYDNNLLTLLHQSTPANGFAALQVMLPGEDRWRSVEPDDDLIVVNVGDSLMYLTEGRAIATKHRVVNPPRDRLAGGARTSIAFFHLPNWDCPLRPVLSDGIDRSLGQAREDFGMDALRDPDGTIPYYRLLQREGELGFVRDEF